jgi:hypothetical protein
MYYYRLQINWEFKQKNILWLTVCRPVCLGVRHASGTRNQFFSLLNWVELSLSYGRQSVDQFILVSGSSLGPMTRFYYYPFFSDNCFVGLPVGRPIWREDRSVTYSAIAGWSGHWGPITIHYRLIWDCVPSSSPLTTRRDYSGGILTRLHTGL